MRRPGRHVPSSIDKLDPEIKRLIADLRLEHGWSIDQIKEKLDELAQPVSRSALARHTKSLEEIGRELRHKREMAKALVEAVNPGDEGKLAELNIELAQTALVQMQTRTGEAGELVEVDAKSAMFTATAIDKLVGASGRIAEIRRKAKDEARKEVLAAVDKVAATKGSGLSAATVAQIRVAVLGDTA